MGKTAVVESTAIVLAGAAEILGPKSQYAIQRSALRNEYTPIIAKAKDLTTVDSQESAETAVEFGRLLQNGTKETKDFFKAIKVQIDEIKEPILAAEKEDLALLEPEKQRLGQALTTYRQKVERERLEAERIAREAAEREAKAAQEEAERLACEEQLARAIEIDPTGESEAAKAVLDAPVIVEPIMAAPVVVQAAAPTKFAGSSGRMNYSAKVVDLMDLVKAIAAGTAPLQAVAPNDVFINQQARSFKEGFSLPGCELERTPSTSFRA